MSRNALLRASLSRRAFAALCGICLLCSLAQGQTTNQFLTGNPSQRARVVTVQDPEATDAFRPNPSIIRAMVNRAMTNLTGLPTPREGWRSLVSTQDTVGIKVFSAPGPNSGTRPAVVAAVIEGLLDAGLPPDHITIWDRQAVDLRLAGFYELAKRYGVKVAGSAQAGYDEKTYYDNALLGNLVWGDVEFGKKGEGVGRKSYISKLVGSDMTKIINISPLLNHNLIGVSGLLYSLALGSVDNVVRFESDPDRLAVAIPEIYSQLLNDRVVLNIVDALICQYEGGERGLLHYSTVLNQLRFSRDPVALDVLSLQELDRQRQMTSAPTVRASVELYNNAALMELGVDDPKKIHVDSLR